MKSATIKKTALVVFLTALIWVWADLAQQEELSNVPGRVYVDESAGEELLVTLDGELSVPIRMTFSGPASNISEVERRLELKDTAKRLKFAFRFDPAAERMGPATGPHTLDVLDFLQKNKDIVKLGVNVKAVTPERLTVRMRKLTPRELAVECFDEWGNPLVAEYIEPSRVVMPVPQEWQGDMLTARVELSKSQREQAAQQPVSVQPFVLIPPGRRIEAEQTVSVKMHPVESLLKERQFDAIIGITCSQNKFGKFDVELLNRDQLPSKITVRATPEAERAYENRSFKLLLVIEDADANVTEPLSRPLVYNFPYEFVRNNEIQSTQPAPEVRFRLIPRPAPRESASVGP